MREIKFRAWDKQWNRMFQHDKWEESCGGLLKLTKKVMPELPNGRDGVYLPLKDENMVFMQFTNIKDKKGNEIYEGDLYLSEDGEDTGIIKYRNDGYYIEWFPPVTFGKRSGLFYNSGGEVIGNIYENSDLLPKANVSTELPRE